MRLCNVEFRKWDGSRHWHFSPEWLGEDEHGSWLGGRPGLTLQRGTELPIPERDGFVMLVPLRGQWLAFWNYEEEFEIYVDVASLPEWEGDTVHAIDMDLDVVRYRDGTVEVIDVDEFEEHKVRYGYSEVAIQDALATAGSLSNMMSAREEPFGDAPAHWLEEFRQTW